MKYLKKGQIVLVELDGIGSEQRGIRPCIIVQNNTGNIYSSTTIIVPLTSRKIKKTLPTHLSLNRENLGPGSSDSICLVEQIKIIDKKRIKYVKSMLSTDKINQLDRKIIISLGLNKIIS